MYVVNLEELSEDRFALSESCPPATREEAGLVCRVTLR